MKTKTKDEVTINGNKPRARWSVHEWKTEEKMEFVKAWQTSSSIQEVADKVGWPKEECQRRAGYMRVHGVKLKRYKAVGYDWEPLKKLAVSLQ